jgi:hypothetical protein
MRSFSAETPNNVRKILLMFFCCRHEEADRAPDAGIDLGLGGRLDPNEGAKMQIAFDHFQEMAGRQAGIRNRDQP